MNALLYHKKNTFCINVYVYVYVTYNYYIYIKADMMTRTPYTIRLLDLSSKPITDIHEIERIVGACWSSVRHASKPAAMLFRISV